MGFSYLLIIINIGSSSVTKKEKKGSRKYYASSVKFTTSKNEAGAKAQSPGFVHSSLPILPTEYLWQLNALKRHRVFRERGLCKQCQQSTAAVKIQVFLNGLLLA